MLSPKFVLFDEQHLDDDWSRSVGSVVVLDASSGERSETLELPLRTICRCVAFSPDGTKLVYAPIDLSLSHPGVRIRRKTSFGFGIANR